MNFDEQLTYVRDFLEFLKKNLEHTAQDFEELQGVSGPEVCVLTNLAENPGATVKDVAQHLPKVSLSTLTRILDNLEEKQYIVRSVNELDRRSFIVSLTPVGQQMVDKYGSCMDQFARLMLEALSPAERLMLIELYNKTWKSLAASQNKMEVKTE